MFRNLFCRSCGTLRSFDSIFQGQKIAASFHSSAPTGGGLNTIHDPRDHCLAIDGRQRLPMMAITRIA
jgi:hypothetical protein